MPISQDSWSLRAPLHKKYAPCCRRFRICPCRPCLLAEFLNGLFCIQTPSTSLLVKVKSPSMKSRVSLQHFASLVKSWLVASAGTGTCSDAKLKTPWRAENHLLRGRDPTWRPMGDAIVIRSWVPRFSVEPRRPAAILLSNYPHDLMVKVLSHGFLPLNLAAYLSEGWLAKVEGVETNPWVRFDPFCI